MKKAYKVLSVLMIVLMVVATCTNVFALSIDDINASANLTGDVNGKMGSIGSTILTIVTNVGIILSVVMIAIMGIKYMMESSEGKAEYKKNMMPYLVGALCVFGAATIAKVVTEFGKSL